MEETKPITMHIMFPKYDFKTLFEIIEPRDMVVEQIKRAIAYRDFSKSLDNLYEDNYSSSSDDEEEGGQVCERPRPVLRNSPRRRDPPPRVSRRSSHASTPTYLRHRFLPRSRKDSSSSRRQR